MRLKSMESQLESILAFSLLLHKTERFMPPRIINTLEMLKNNRTSSCLKLAL